MTVFLFLIDTSASMAQKNYKGYSALDVCKSFVYDLIKARGRDVSKSFDRYMVLTTEEFPGCVRELRLTYKENVLVELMKSLKPSGRHSFPAALINAFKFLNMQRQSTGIDNYGYGRFPYYIEPVFVISMTDGRAIDEIPKEFKLDLMLKPELNKEAYRWDQRMFSLVIRLPAQHPRIPQGSRVDVDKDAIERLCSATGGRSFSVSCHRQLGNCVDIISQSLQIQGIGVRFVCPGATNLLLKLNGDGQNSQSPESTPEMRLKLRLEARPLTTVMVRMVGGKAITNHWPIPEEFWHSRLESGGLPARPPHPSISFGMEPTPSLILTDFPFDKYELEPSPVADYVLERLDKTDQCLHVFVKNSGRTEGYGKPFGYLKVTSSGTGVNLFLMPYNYPVLISLLQELKADQSIRSNPTWRKRLDSYLESVPQYYITQLRKSLLRFKIGGGLLDENNPIPSIYPQPIMANITRLRTTGKEEYDRAVNVITALIQQNLNVAIAPRPQAVSLERRDRVVLRKHWRLEMEATRRDKVRDRDRKDPRNEKAVLADDELFKDPEQIDAIPPIERLPVQVIAGESKLKPAQGSTFRNPLVIKSREIVHQLPRMRVNMDMLLRDSPVPLLEGGRPGFNIKLHHAEELHSLPVALMGNFDDYIKAQAAIGRAPLREVEPQGFRSHAFGNPFKTDKKSLAIDEVGEGPTIDTTSAKESRRDRKASSAQTGRPPRRKPGPLSSNSLGQWRERRRTISERSSVVSDVSYMSDLTDDLIELAGPSSGHANGLPANSAPTTNGKTLAMDGIVCGLENWGLEEEGEDSETEEPPAKKMRPNNGNATQSTNRVKDLPLAEMCARKMRISAIIRTPGNGASVSKEIASTVSEGSARDCLELVEYALRDSRRFKRKTLSEELHMETLRLKKLVFLL